MLKQILNHCWPQADNYYLPGLLRRGAIIGMTFLVFLSFLLANFQALLWQTSDWLVGAILPAVVVTLTNNEREALAAPPLKRSSVLDQAAKLKAEHMAAGEYFSHNSPTGITPWHWFEEVGYVYAHAGENLAVYFSDSDEVVKAWMDSPTHRANIVNVTYQEIGIGTAKGRYQGYDTVFVVQLFGTPAVPPQVAKVDDEEVVTESDLTQTATSTATTTATTSLDTLIVQADNPTLVLGVETEIDTTPATSLNNEPKIILNDVSIETEMTEAVVPETKSEVVTSLPNESLFLSPVATSSGLIPAPVISQIQNEQEVTSFGASLATQPNKVLKYLYLIVGTLTAIALWSSVLVAWRQRRLVDVSYGLALLLLMSGLFYVHQLITSGALVA